MPIHRFERPRGRLESLEIESAAVANNILGDPTRRTVMVYLPEDYDSGNEHYPLLVDIVGYTGSGLGHLNWKAFGENVPQQVDRLVTEGKMGPAIIAFPDCFTALGGNQYVNSSVLGNWADFLTLEMVPELESRYRLSGGREHRGLFGNVAANPVAATGRSSTACSTQSTGERWPVTPVICPSTCATGRTFPKP